MQSQTIFHGIFDNNLENRKKLMNKLQYFLIIISILITINSQNFTVSLNTRLLLNQNSAGITTIGKDMEGNFLVGFANGQARKYVPDFSSFTSISVPEPVDQFNTRSINLFSTLSNGTSIKVNDRRMVAKSNSFKTVRGYDYYSFTNYENYSVNQTIHQQMGFPIKVSSVSHCFYVLVCHSTIYVMYRGTIQATLALQTYFGTGATCRGATIHQYLLSMQGNNFDATFKYYIGISDGSVYYMTLSLNFQFNFTINHYDFKTITLNKTHIFTSSSPITYLCITNGLLMMQSNTTGQTYIYNINSNTVGTVSGVPLNQTFNFLYINSAYYVLQSTGLLKLSYNSASNTMTMNATMTQLPYNTYGLNFGSAIDPFYIPGLPYLYKGGNCMGNAQMIGSICVSYNCSVVNCLSCGINAALCSACIAGYSLSGNQCSLSIIITINVTNFNTSSNSFTDLSTDTNPFPQFAFMNQLFNLLGFLISIPTARRVITPFFFYFGIFDDIYLFQFHDRVYGNTMKGIFSSINEIENKKWSLINYQEVINWLGVKSDQFSNDTDYQNSYEYFRFKDSDHSDVGPEGLWSNCQNFFMVNIPITVFCFIIFRFIFKALFKYSISRWIRKFEIWSLMFLLLFDGNIQQLAFYQTTDWRNMFAFSFFQKLIKMQVIYFGFILVLISVGIIFVSYGLYNKLNKHIMSNNKNDMPGQISLSLQLGIKNFLFGVMHSLLRNTSYYKMLSVLLGVQVFFNIGFLFSISTNIYWSKFKMWIYFFLNFFKVILIVTLYIDYQNINISIIQTAQMYLIYSEIVIFCIGVLHETLCTLIELYEALRTSCKAKQSQSTYGFKEQYLKKALSYKGASVYIVNLNPNKTFTRPKQSRQELISRAETQRTILQKKTMKPGRLETSIKKGKKVQTFPLKINYSF